LKIELELETPSVIYAVGAPGCGKTTHLKPYAESINATYLNPDHIRARVLGDEFDRTDDNLVWQILNTSAKLALKAGRHVVVDAKNNDPNYRRQDAADYKQHGAKRVIALLFERPLETCLSNNSQRPNPIPEADIKKAFEHIVSEPPSEAEGFNQIVKIGD